MTETPAATERRHQREQELERVGGSSSEQGQELLDLWWRQDRDTRRGGGDVADEDE